MDALIFRCSATTRFGRCRSQGDSHAIRLMVYNPDARLGFCSDHWPDREDYRPASASDASAAMQKVVEIMARTHTLGAACRHCGVVDAHGQTRICDACGAFDLEPVTIPIVRKKLAPPPEVTA